MNTIQNLCFAQKYDDILLDILFGKVYPNYVSINLHVAWLIHLNERRLNPRSAGYDEPRIESVKILIGCRNPEIRYKKIRHPYKNRRGETCWNVTIQKQKICQNS